MFLYTSSHLTMLELRVILSGDRTCFPCIDFWTPPLSPHKRKVKCVCQQKLKLIRKNVIRNQFCHKILGAESDSIRVEGNEGHRLIWSLKLIGNRQSTTETIEVLRWKKMANKHYNHTIYKYKSNVSLFIMSPNLCPWSSYCF